MIKHFHSACVIISADRGWRLRAPDSSVRKARCLYTRTRSEGREGANGVGGGFRVGGGNRDGNGVEAGTRTSTVMGTGTEGNKNGCEGERRNARWEYKVERGRGGNGKGDGGGD